MKFLKSFALAATAAFAFTFTTSADYGPLGTLWNATSITNVTGTSTNVNAAVNATKTAEITVQFTLGFTNACAGTYDVRWTCSADGETWVSAPAAPGASGWFSIPLTNGGAVVTWVTNVPMSSCGHYKVDWGTNQAGQSLTSAVVRAYIKPNRTARDY